MRSRLLSMGIGVLALIAALVCVPSTAFAARSPSPATQLAAAGQHDLSHPVKEDYPCRGMAHSGVSSTSATLQFNCSQQATGGHSTQGQ